MPSNPLAPPADRRTLELFLRHFRLTADAPAGELLADVVAAFARLPYENLSKIVRFAAVGAAEGASEGAPRRALRPPSVVVEEHCSLGAGGTCFSLTAALLHLLRALGWTAEPILADRRYGADTHCALLVWIDDRPHLLDPGYLIVAPIALEPSGVRRVATEFNDLTLTPHDAGRRIELHTIAQGRTTYRLTFKPQPVDAERYLEAWQASFGWESMRRPVLTQVADGRQTYLHGRRLQVRDRQTVTRRELAPERLAAEIEATFGVSAALASQALVLCDP